MTLSLQRAARKRRCVREIGDLGWMSFPAAIDHRIQEYETTMCGGHDGEARFELRHVPAASSDTDDITTAS